MKKSILLLLALMFLFGTVTAADAHSTKGRKKVFLKKDIITTDDMAYYIESYIHRKKYKHLYKESENRFYIKDFLEVKQKDGTAEVFFTVLDVKNNRVFGDFMSFKKGNDGIWLHVDTNNNTKKVYTYVSKKGYYAKYMEPFYLTVIILAFGIFIFIRAKEYLKKKAKKNNPEPGMIPNKEDMTDD